MNGNRIGFFVGQPVYSPFFGNGTITGIRTDDDVQYPVIVNFGDSEHDVWNLRAFASNGSYYHGDIDPKMDIHARDARDDHASLPVAWPGPISRLMFSNDLETTRVKLLIGGGGYVMGILSAVLVLQ